MRITELFTAKSIELDSAASNRDEILSRLVELQATHGNITDTEAYKKALYAREDEASTYVDNGITVPHAKTNVVTRPSLAALRLSTPVQYNAEDEGKTDLLFAIAAPENGSLHVDMLARMMQMLMNEDFVEKLRAAKTPAEFLDAIDAQEEAQFGDESFTQQQIPQNGYRVLAVTACPNGIAHTYMAAEALVKAAGSARESGDQRLRRHQERPDPERDRGVRRHHRGGGQERGNGPLWRQARPVHPGGRRHPQTRRTHQESGPR